MKLEIFTLILVFSLAITGCSSNRYTVVYDSTPRGAELICRGSSQGYTPSTLYYTLTEDNKKSGSANITPCTVQWVSGARASAGGRVDLNRFPRGVKITTQRPNVAGYEKDATFALKVQSLRAQQAQARAAQSAADSAANAVNEMNRPRTCYNNGFSVTCY